MIPVVIVLMSSMPIPLPSSMPQIPRFFNYGALRPLFMKYLIQWKDYPCLHGKLMLLH